MPRPFDLKEFLTNDPHTLTTRDCNDDLLRLARILTLAVGFKQAEDGSFVGKKGTYLEPVPGSETNRRMSFAPNSGPLLAMQMTGPSKQVGEDYLEAHLPLAEYDTGKRLYLPYVSVGLVSYGIPFGHETPAETTAKAYASVQVLAQNALALYGAQI